MLKFLFFQKVGGGLLGENLFLLSQVLDSSVRLSCCLIVKIIFYFIKSPRSTGSSATTVEKGGRGFCDPKKDS